MRVVFMGTPDIAATCLKRILADGFQVVGVYTQPQMFLLLERSKFHC